MTTAKPQRSVCQWHEWLYIPMFLVTLKLIKHNFAVLKKGAG